MRRAFVLLGLLALACGNPVPEPQPEPPSKSLLSTALKTERGEEPVQTPPDRGEPPPTPEREEDALPAPSEDEPAACKAARERREKQEDRITRQRESAVNASETAANVARTQMSDCMTAEDCAADAKELIALQDRINASEANYEASLARVGELEAELYSIDQEIKSVCGLPGR